MIITMKAVPYNLYMRILGRNDTSEEAIYYWRDLSKLTDYYGVMQCARKMAQFMEKYLISGDGPNE